MSCFRCIWCKLRVQQAGVSCPELTGVHEQDASSDGFSEYTAGLQPLAVQAPSATLISAARSGLPGDALLEQFQRAQAYVARHEPDFPAEIRVLLEVVMIFTFHSKINSLIEGW